MKFQRSPPPKDWSIQFVISSFSSRVICKTSAWAVHRSSVNHHSHPCFSYPVVSRSQGRLSWLGKGEETSCCEWAEVEKGPDFLWNKQVELLFPGDGLARDSVSGLGSCSRWAELMQGRGRTPGLFLDTSGCWTAAWLHNGRGGIYFTISWAFFSVAV